MHRPTPWGGESREHQQLPFPNAEQKELHLHQLSLDMIQVHSCPELSIYTSFSDYFQGKGTIIFELYLIFVPYQCRVQKKCWLRSLAEGLHASCVVLLQVNDDKS